MAQCCHTELFAISTADLAASVICALRISDGAFLPVPAVVEWMPNASRLLYDDVFPYFPGDARTALACIFHNLLEAVIGLKS